MMIEADILLEDIRRIIIWLKDWQMLFNIDECCDQGC